jgi:hypothetical protein
MTEQEDRERLKYRQFVGMLNAIRGRGLLTASQRREYDARWRSESGDRDFILEELGRIMENYSEDEMMSQGPPEEESDTR